LTAPRAGPTLGGDDSTVDQDRLQAAGDYRIFSVRSDEKVSPRTGQTHDFFIIDCVDWVNVLAVTPQQELVMVEQFRHGRTRCQCGLIEVSRFP